MLADDWINAFAIPAEARIDKRVPKSILTEQFGSSSSNRKRIESIDSFYWIAALKPEAIGVSLYRDEIREYLEIAVVLLILRSQDNKQKIIEWVHRSIPYPLILVTEYDESIVISAAHKRFSLNEKNAIVLDGDVIATRAISKIYNGSVDESTVEFKKSLTISEAPRSNLHAFYQGYIERIEAYRAAAITNRYFLFPDPAGSSDRRSALLRYAQIERDIADLRSRAKRESQISRTVEINMEIVRLKNDLENLKSQL